MPRNTVRVDIPRNPDECIALLERVLLKHTELGTSSPLKDLPMERLQALTSGAKTKQELAKQLSRDSETAIEERNKLLGKDTQTEDTARFILVQIRDSLLSKEKGYEHRLGDWGFEVDASAQTVTPGTG